MLIVVLVIAAIVLVGMAGLRIANQYERAVVFQLGRYRTTLGPGLAEALREKRAVLIKAQAEYEAAEQLRAASEIIMRNPAGLKLRRMQSSPRWAPSRTP
jgi:regulator of protease activity HflC (stomatin/prohibitin superfamily)